MRDEIGYSSRKGNGLFQGEISGNAGRQPFRIAAIHRQERDLRRKIRKQYIEPVEGNRIAGMVEPQSVRIDAVAEKGMPAERIAVSWFQGVTPRTAGFNSVDVAAIHDSTAMMFISLMLIGGGPTSTAGGIKVTTFVVMILATTAFFRRQTELHAFGRSIGFDQILKVTALIAISAILVFVAIFLLAATHDGHFLDICFEVASAFGTVGLSRNYTDDLNGFGRAVIIAVMFLGRVGPLTLGFFLATRATPRVRYPKGVIYLG